MRGEERVFEECTDGQVMGCMCANLIDCKTWRVMRRLKAMLYFPKKVSDRSKTLSLVQGLYDSCSCDSDPIKCLLHLRHFLRQWCVQMYRYDHDLIHLSLIADLWVLKYEGPKWSEPDPTRFPALNCGSFHLLFLITFKIFSLFLVDVLHHFIVFWCPSSWAETALADLSSWVDLSLISSFFNDLIPLLELIPLFQLIPLLELISFSLCDWSLFYVTLSLSCLLLLL